MASLSMQQLEKRGTETPSPLSRQSRDKLVPELESAYESWFASYVNQRGKCWGVYAPKGNAFAIKFADKADKPNIVSYMRGLLIHFAFFPGTKAPRHARFTSDHDAMLNDWAMIGSDLYGAIRQYRIESGCVRTDHETAGKPVAPTR